MVARPQLALSQSLGSSRRPASRAALSDPWEQSLWWRPWTEPRAEIWRAPALVQRQDLPVSSAQAGEGRSEREELVACTAECTNAAWLVEKWVEVVWQPMLGHWASWTVAWQPMLGQLTYVLHYHYQLARCWVCVLVLFQDANLKAEKQCKRGTSKNPKFMHDFTIFFIYIMINSYLNSCVIVNLCVMKCNILIYNHELMYK